MATTTEGALQDAEYDASLFSVDLKYAGKALQGFFTSISGLGVEINVVDVISTDAKGQQIARKRPGTTKYAEIVMKRTLTKDKTFWDWVKAVRDGNLDYRSNGSVYLHDRSGAIVGTWEFLNCWPSKWSASDLDVGTDDVMEEEVTLQVELITRKK